MAAKTKQHNAYEHGDRLIEIRNCVAVKDPRDYLNHIAVEFMGGTAVRFSATDGRRAMRLGARDLLLSDAPEAVLAAPEGLPHRYWLCDVESWKVILSAYKEVRKFGATPMLEVMDVTQVTDIVYGVPMSTDAVRMRVIFGPAAGIESVVTLRSGTFLNIDMLIPKSDDERRGGGYADDPPIDFPVSLRLDPTLFSGISGPLNFTIKRNMIRDNENERSRVMDALYHRDEDGDAEVFIMPLTA